MAVNEATGRWFSVAEAAAALGVPERTIYRKIATQALRARRDDQGALQVCVDESVERDSPPARLAVSDEREVVLTPERARALSEFASGLVEPLVARLAQQEAVIREQAEELGRLRARLQLEGELDDRLAPALGHQLAELAAIREEIEQLGRRRRWWPFS